MQERAETEREQETYSDRRLPHKPDPGKTHFEGCWQQPGHHNCAVVRARNLAAERDRLVEAVEEVVDERFSRPHRPMRESRAIESVREELAGLQAVEGDGVEPKVVSSQCFRDEGGVLLCGGCRVQIGERHQPGCNLATFQKHDPVECRDAAPQDADAEGELEGYPHDLSDEDLASRLTYNAGLGQLTQTQRKVLREAARRLRRGGGEERPGGSGKVTETTLLMSEVQHVLSTAADGCPWCDKADRSEIHQHNCPLRRLSRALDRLWRSTPDGEGESDE